MRLGNVDPAVNGWATGKITPTAQKPCRGYPSQARYANCDNGLAILSPAIRLNSRKQPRLGEGC